MIKFEHNMLVLNNSFSQEDVEQINNYADYVRSQERERIIALIESKDEWHYAFSDVSDIIALIKGEGNWADSVQEMKKDWPE
jgi:hypothetical protein